MQEHAEPEHAEPEHAEPEAACIDAPNSKDVLTVMVSQSH